MVEINAVFESECLDIATDYQALADKTQWWTWPEGALAEFQLGYNVNDPAKTVNLPSFSPVLGTGHDFYEVCGEVTYVIVMQQQTAIFYDFKADDTPFDQNG